MIDALTYVTIAVSLVLAVWACVLVVKNTGIDDILLIGSAVLVLLVVIQLVIGLVLLAGLDRSIESATFIGYLIGSAIIPPLAVLWGLTERSRYGPAVIFAAYIVMPVLEVRLLEIWNLGA